MSKTKKFWNATKLRLALFRVWFMKNLIVFLQVALIILAICTFTGAITADTPILGKIIYPIFSGLIDQINEAIEDNGTETLVGIFTAALSILISIGVFTIKLKSICLADIKSDKLKLALIKANMYFNADGKLVKKTEKMTGTDLDGDGKIAEGEAAVSTNIFTGVKNAIQELGAILTINLEDDDTYEDALEKTDLSETAEAVEEVSQTVKSGLIDVAADATDEIILTKVSETEADNELDSEEKIEKVSGLYKFRNKMRNWFGRKKKEVEETSNEEVLENNMEEDSEKVETTENETTETTEIKEEKTKENEEKNEKTVETKNETKTTAKKSSNASLDKFLAKFDR